jgi:hypothetical protein
MNKNEKTIWKSEFINTKQDLKHYEVTLSG